MTRLANFIDAGHLAKVTEEMGFPFIDFATLAERMADGQDVYKNFYYDCLPFLGKFPTDSERSCFHRKRRFFRALEYLPRFNVRLGRLQFCGLEPDGRPRFQQKRVDVFAAVDLTILSTKRLITHAAIFAADSDFIPAIAAAQSEGVHVHLFHGRSANDDLIRLCNRVTQITPDFLKSIARVVQPFVSSRCAVA